MTSGEGAGNPATKPGREGQRRSGRHREFRRVLEEYVVVNSFVPDRGVSHLVDHEDFTAWLISTLPPEVMERLLLRRVEPVYPEAARRANFQGVVMLDAVIAADGTVVNLHPLSGPDALVSAAMDAARWWRFRPYRVHGEATAVETTLSVEFRL